MTALTMAWQVATIGGLVSSAASASCTPRLLLQQMPIGAGKAVAGMCRQPNVQKILVQGVMHVMQV